jgi:hypothetical protein
LRDKFGYNVTKLSISIPQERRRMNKFDFNIGATVHCKNGKFGKLQKLVVDPKSMEITDLVVGKGFLRIEERIVPVSVVDCANDE